MKVNFNSSIRLTVDNERFFPKMYKKITYISISNGEKPEVEINDFYFRFEQVNYKKYLMIQMHQTFNKT